MQEFLLHAYYTSLVIITFFAFSLLFSKKVRNWTCDIIIDSRFFNWMQSPSNKPLDKEPPTQSIDHLVSRIDRLQFELDKIKKDNWISSNTPKFKYGDKVTFRGKECQIIECKAHQSTVGFNWVYRLIEIGGTIVIYRKHNGYLASDAQVGSEFQFESEINKAEKVKKKKKKKKKK